jgi:hypothetical protein
VKYAPAVTPVATDAEFHEVPPQALDAAVPEVPMPEPFVREPIVTFASFEVGTNGEVPQLDCEYIFQ